MHAPQKHALPRPTRRLTAAVVPLAAALLLLAAGCPERLSSTAVESREGFVRARVPLGVGWHCDKNDADKEKFQHRGVKCIYDPGIVLNAKVYDIDTGDTRTAELFCIQDWTAAYAGVFKAVTTYTHEIVDWRGTPACRVTIDGMSSKGPWHLWEIHAPNGKRMVQVTVSGSTPIVEAQQKVVDAWLDDLHTDVKVPGQQ